ncbi:MAG: HlyD family efflux transporter periplasmic adaptor subunit [Gammaproteobacteria bacterium]|nr:HlyD family efflux transporter periplasmic adaptor subunit [Gammaproteobacteria bacterium]
MILGKLVPQLVGADSRRLTQGRYVQPLLVIVPGDNPLEVETFVENKDIGFVRAGQTAEVKVETLNFTQYGTLHGTVMQVSGDAIQDEKRGLINAARVKLDRTTLNLNPAVEAVEA